MEYYAITNAFSHTHGSCLSFPPKNKWIYETPEVIDEEHPTVFIDDYVIFGCSALYHGKSKFGWLCESSAIIPNVKNFLQTNLYLFEKNYVKIFTNDVSLLKISNVFEYCPAGSNMPWITSWEITQKDKLISLIASDKKITKGHLLRHKLADLYRNNIDLFGREYKPIDTKDEALKPYMFSFCIENDNYDFYYTEKLTDAIACGTIPIYWGSKKIKDVFNPDGFIFFDEMFDITKINKNLYDLKFKAVIENFEILKNLEPSDNTIQKKIKEIIDEK
jgi:hypothetical protein